MSKNFQKIKKDSQNIQNSQREDEDLKKILAEIDKLEKFRDLDIKSVDDEGGYADTIAIKLKELPKDRKLKTTQLRRFFGNIKKIDRRLKGGENWSNAEFYRLKRLLVYAKGRRLVPDEFFDIIKLALTKIDVGSEHDKKKNFDMFVEFLESIVCYHKYHGGE